MKPRLLDAICACVVTIITTSTNAALVDNGGGLIYDDVLDITWAQPATDRNWYAAKNWAAGLTLGGGQWLAAALYQRSGGSGSIYRKPRLLQYGERSGLP